MTLAVVPNTEPARYGGVLMGDDDAVTGFVGRGSQRPSWHFIGVQVVEASAFAGLPADVLEERGACLNQQAQSL